MNLWDNDSISAKTILVCYFVSPPFLIIFLSSLFIYYSFNYSTIINYLMTVSEVDKGKSPTGASIYWPSDGRAEVWDFLAFERTFEVIKLFITWRQTEKTKIYSSRSRQFTSSDVRVYLFINSSTQTHSTTTLLVN